MGEVRWWRGVDVGDGVAAQGRRRRRSGCGSDWYSGDRVSGTEARGGSDIGGGGGGGRSPSSIFLEQPLVREFTPFFLQMMAMVCGGVPSPLIEPKMGREGKGPT